MVIPQPQYSKENKSQPIQPPPSSIYLNSCYLIFESVPFDSHPLTCKESHPIYNFPPNASQIRTLTCGPVISFSITTLIGLWSQFTMCSPPLTLQLLVLFSKRQSTVDPQYMRALLRILFLGHKQTPAQPNPLQDG